MKQGRTIKLFGILTMIFGVLAFAAEICLTVFQKTFKAFFSPSDAMNNIFNIPITMLIVTLLCAAVYIIFVVFSFNMESGKRIAMLAIGTGVRLLLGVLSFFFNLIEIRIIVGKYGVDYFAGHNALAQAERFIVSPLSFVAFMFMSITLGIAIGINIKNKEVQ